MRHWTLRILAMVIVGLIAGPIVGMVVAEHWSGATDTFVAKEHGFVGFCYGLWIGPLLGAVAGVVLAASQRRARY